MVNEFDTIAAIATAVSNAGIGIIRISGSEAMTILGDIFKPYNEKKDPHHLESHRIYYGNIVDGDEIIDECIVLIMKGPHSYTREDVVEIDCHGGISVVYRILNLVISKGARPAEPGEFTKRAFLNGRMDLSQAEAVMDLIHAKNDMARKNSTSMLKGRLSEKIREIRSEILYQIAYIESALDDPEHISLDGYADTLEEYVDKWIKNVDTLLNSYDNGRIISEGIRTCIVGKPNAGKSSFLNALLGEERAIVTDVAGPTRDTLEESVTIDGITLNIIDTAGIRETEDTVEKIGVKKAKEEMENADLVLFVADTSCALGEEDRDILHQIREKKKIILLNKTDMSSGFDEKEINSYISPEDPVISISAKFGTGMEDFIRELKNLMFHGKIDANQEIYITNARHRKALEDTLVSLQCVRDSILNQMPEDFYTIDMMNAYEKAGLIIGESVEEDLVNEIFSRFCTGK